VKVNARAISAFANGHFPVFVTDLLPFLFITLAIATATFVESAQHSYFYSILSPSK
jgi:hypothetical protein